jgi:hypothetical protein
MALDNPIYPVHVRKMSVVERAQWFLKKPLPWLDGDLARHSMLARMIIEELVKRVKALEAIPERGDPV